MTEEGGAHEILKKIIQLLQSKDTEEFTSKELIELSDLCQQSIKNNLTRLVNAGYIERIEYMIPGKCGRRVKYHFREEALKFVKQKLY